MHTPGVRTDPADAAATSPPPVSTPWPWRSAVSHAMLTRDAVARHGLIAGIAAAVPVPLVLHGRLACPTPTWRGGRAGMRRSTSPLPEQGDTGAVRDALADEALVDPRKYLGPGRSAVAREVERLLRLLVPTG